MTPLEALARARAAWEATQPQLFLELWPDIGLNEPLRHPLGDGERRLVEPALGRAPQASRPRGGLNPGPEPNGDLIREQPVVCSVAVPPVLLPLAGGSGPLTNTTGTDATPDREDRARPRR